MAKKPLRPCRKPGCSELTSTGWCAGHKPKSVARRTKSESWHRWYYLPIWTKRLRPSQLGKEPFCRECRDHGLRARATDVDHIIPHRGDWKRFVDPTNLQSLCHGCHSAKTLRELVQNSKKL